LGNAVVVAISSEEDDDEDSKEDDDEDSEEDDDDDDSLLSISVTSRFLGRTDLGTPGKFVKCIFNSDGKG